MAAYSYPSVVGTTIAFNAAADTLTLIGDPVFYSFANNATGGLNITNSAGNTATLSGFTLAQLTTGNIVFSSSTGHVYAGDNTTAITSDGLAQIAGGPLDRVAAATTDLNANNILFGLGGDDIIKVGNGDNVIYGGTAAADSTDGSDTITIDGTGIASGNNTIFLDAGNDTVLFTDPVGTGKAALIYGGNGNDDVEAGAGAGSITFYAGAGNDTMNGTGFTGSMTVFGGAGTADTTDGDDLIISGVGNTIIYANAGNDNIQLDDFGSTVGQTVYGGLGNDTVRQDVDGTGATGTLAIFGNAGTDLIDMTGHHGAATVYGGNASADTSDGADTFLFGTANAGAHMLFYGNAGNDTFTSTAALAAGESATLYGGLGSDNFIISGDRSATSTLVIYGNEGADSITVNDLGLTGNATTTFMGFEATDKLTITLAGGHAADLTVTGLGESVTITDPVNGKYVFSGYTGGFTATNLVFSDGSALLSNIGGAKGALTGTVNNDQIFGGSNGDTLSGGGGDDKITGGGGADNITGGDGTDTILGGEGNDTIDAGVGTALGGAVDSVVDGGTGSDSITGGAFEDSLLGSNGNDTLAGGAGIDTLTGGNENDTFKFAILDKDLVDTNVDEITDAFNGNDVVDFSDLTNANLRGTGVSFAIGNASTAQVLGANVGLYVATNAAADFSEANIYAALGGIGDDLAAGDILYVLVSNGVDARLVQITEAANPGSLVAADDTMMFVARLDGIDTADLSGLAVGNFADFI